MWYRIAYNRFRKLCWKSSFFISTFLPPFLLACNLFTNSCQLFLLLFSLSPPQEILGALPSFSKFGGCKCCSDRFAGSFSIENGSVERCAKNKRHIVICFLWCCQKRWCHQNCKHGVISWGSLVRTYFVPVTLCGALLVAGWVGSPFTLMVQP